jgi:hypothetical protein
MYNEPLLIGPDYDALMRGNQPSADYCMRFERWAAELAEEHARTWELGRPKSRLLNEIQKRHGKRPRAVSSWQIDRLEAAAKRARGQ